MGIAFETREEMTMASLDGLVDISSAAELKGQLLTAVDSGKPLRVSLEAATYLDVTVVQLLWAAEKMARASGVAFGFDGTIPAPLLAQLAEAGFTWVQSSVVAG